jgi:hypothetical protein
VPILIEQERLFNKEANFINDPTAYAVTCSTGAWETVHDYGNVTLTESGILLIKGESYQSSGSILVRFNVGGTTVYVYNETSPTTPVLHGVAVYLAAGTYDVLVQALNNAGHQIHLNNFQAGFIKFNDLQGAAVQTYSNSIALTVANRTTPPGNLKQATWMVNCCAVTAGGQSNFENVGDNLTNGVSITVDATQVNWDERLQDTGSGIGACARFAQPFNVGSSHTLAISKRNANTVVTITIIACPWILSAAAPDIIPIDLDVSQGTTFYISLEPMMLNPAKFVGIGAVRAISFGDASDYYNSTTGTGLIQYAVTLDVYDTSSIDVYCYGFGGCIGYIGCDVR